MTAVYTPCHAPGSANLLVRLILFECGAAYPALNLDDVGPTPVDRMDPSA